MTKTEFIAKVAQKSALSQKDTTEVLEASIETIIELLQENDSISFSGFGSFSTVERASREIKLPQSGELVQIAAKKVVKFKVGKRLKESIS